MSGNPPKVTIKKRIFNDVYYKHLHSWELIELFYGGAGSGKSYFVAQRCVYRMMMYPGYNILAVRKIASANHDSTFALIRQIINSWGVTQLFIINESKGDESITCYNGSQMLFKGMKDEKEREKIKSITFKQGILIAIWAEELSEFTQQDVYQLRLRLRGKSKYKKQFTGTFNPIRKTHWLKREYFDKDAGAMILKTTYKDNKFLSQEDRDIIEDLKNHDLIYYNIYALGEWGEIGNCIFSKFKTIDIIYPDYEIEGKRYKLTPDDYYDQIVQGMDFGFDHPSVFERIGYKDGKLHVFSEVWGTKLTNEQWMDHLEDYYKKQGCLEQIKRTKTTADSAEPARITAFRRRGWSVYPARKGSDSPRFGIDYLRHREIIIDTKCNRFSEEIQVYRNKLDKDGNIIENKFVDEFDDAIAATRYATEEIWSKGRVKAGTFSASKLGF
jgi:phage terminase large subunit